MIFTNCYFVKLKFLCIGQTDYLDLMKNIIAFGLNLFCFFSDALGLHT